MLNRLKKVCIVTYDEYINIPFIKKYEELLYKHNIKYDIILWDRRNLSKKCEKKDNCYIFRTKTGRSRISKIFPFIKWRKYTLKILNKNKYDKIIILTTLPGILLYSFIIKNFRNRFILDIRDFTYENFNGYKKKVDCLVDASYLTLISSKGFLSWLIPNPKIIPNHNISNVEKEEEEVTLKKEKKPITIGFVGGIRFYNENKALIKALGNNRDYILLYVGKVHPGIRLKQFCKKNKIGNVIFMPAYDNEEKPQIYKKIDIINAVYGAESQITKTALPNKLYDCILFKKPIMVSYGTYLSKIVMKNNLGFSVKLETDDLIDKIAQYIEAFDEDRFKKSCKKVIKIAQYEELKSQKRIEDFLIDVGDKLSGV